MQPLLSPQEAADILGANWNNTPRISPDPPTKKAAKVSQRGLIGATTPCAIISTVL